MSQINIKEKTKKQLDGIKHPGQSYDGLIQELLAALKQLEKISRNSY